MVVTESKTYTLFFCRYSLLSQVIRHTLAVRGNPNPDVGDIVVKQQEIDIVYNLEQLEEHYLCEVNPRGEVSTTPSSILIAQASTADVR
jgi:hypothetical protein